MVLVNIGVLETILYFVLNIFEPFNVFAIPGLGSVLQVVALELGFSL